MSALKELLITEMQDLLHAEGQLLKALPKMTQAANHPKLKEAFEKHLVQTQGQVERLQQAFQLLGADAKAKPCRAMQGLIEEGEETISEGKGKDPIAADLALITAAQKVEHYEIAGYGTVRTIASHRRLRRRDPVLAHPRRRRSRRSSVDRGCQTHGAADRPGGSRIRDEAIASRVVAGRAAALGQGAAGPAEVKLAATTGSLSSASNERRRSGCPSSQASLCSRLAQIRSAAHARRGMPAIAAWRLAASSNRAAAYTERITASKCRKHVTGSRSENAGNGDVNGMR